MKDNLKHLIRELKDKLNQNKDILIKNISEDSGIDRIYLNEEFDNSLIALKGLLKQYNKVISNKEVYIPHYNKKSFFSFSPKGRVLLILPSSSPILSNILIPLSAAISGNEVIVKSSSRSIYLSKFMSNFYKKLNYKKIIYEFGSGKEFIFSLIQKNIDFVFFMGSERNGKIIKKYCSSKGIEFLGEFEGNDWAILFYMDKKILKEINDNILSKNGKDCDSIKGLLIHSKIYPKFLKEVEAGFIDKVNIIKFPNLSQIKKPPFVSSLWIKEFKNLNEIKNIFKHNTKGLSACIYDDNDKRAIDLAKSLPVSRVIINSDTLDIHPLIPWGGIKGSSERGSEYWFMKFINKKLIEISKN